MIISLYQKAISCLLGLNFLKFTSISDVENHTKRLHIFGSGSSALETKFFVKNDDAKYACNLACQFLNNWTILFVENLSGDSYGLKQVDALMSVKCDSLVLKNVYPHRNMFSIKKIIELKKIFNFMLLNETQMGPDRVLSELIKYINSDKTDEIIPQYASSVLTMLLVGVKNGYRDIVLHGVDFGYFDGTFAKKHSTELLAPPFSKVLDFLIRELKSKNVIVKFAKELI